MAEQLHDLRRADVLLEEVGAVGVAEDVRPHPLGVDPGPRGFQGVPIRRGSIVRFLRDEDYGKDRWAGDGVRFRLTPPETIGRRLAATGDNAGKE